MDGGRNRTIGGMANKFQGVGNSPEPGVGAFPAATGPTARDLPARPQPNPAPQEGVFPQMMRVMDAQSEGDRRMGLPPTYSQISGDRFQQMNALGGLAGWRSPNPGQQPSPAPNQQSFLSPAQLLARAINSQYA